MNSLQALTAADVGYDLKGPCGDCPFRRNAPEHEGIVANVCEYVETIQRGGFAHTCHKTDNRADGPRNHVGQVQHCAGALHFLIRAKCDLQLPLLKAADAGKVDLKTLRRRALRDESVFGSLGEMLAYYYAVAQRILDASTADPLVYAIDTDFAAPIQLKLSEAQSRRLDLIECKVCGGAAVKIDGLWPYHTTENFCVEHETGGAKASIADLEAAKATVLA